MKDVGRIVRISRVFHRGLREFVLDREQLTDLDVFGTVLVRALDNAQRFEGRRVRI